MGSMDAKRTSGDDQAGIEELLLKFGEAEPSREEVSAEDTAEVVELEPRADGGLFRFRLGCRKAKAA